MRNISDVKSNAYQQPVFPALNSDRNRIFIGIKKRKKIMETTITVLTYLGIPSYLFVFLDAMKWVELSGWKLIVLFILSALMLLARLIVYCVKSYQEIRQKNKEFTNEETEKR